MKLARQLKQVCEALSSNDLDKFWSAVQKHCFKSTPQTKQESTLLLSDDAARFEAAVVGKSYRDSDNFEKQLESSLEPYFRINLKDLLSFVYNEYVADSATSDVDDEKLVTFFLSKLKGQKMDFAATTEVLFTARDDRENESADYDVEGELVVTDYDYDKNKDLLEIYKVNSLKLNSVEQR